MHYTPLLAASAAALLFAPAGSPAFHPSAGTEITKTITFSTQFELDDYSLVIDGEELDPAMMIGDIEFSGANETSVSVHDTYLAIGDGKPTRLRRTFESASSNTTVDIMGMGEDNSQEMSASSDLEGQTVIFTWNADEDEYTVAYDGEGGDEELLNGLEEDMDLRAFLPEGPVAKGDSWEVALADLGSLMPPGGELFSADGDEELDMEALEELLGGDLTEAFEDLLKGTVTCTYMGAGDDGNIGTIRIRADIDSTVDVADFLADIIDVGLEEAPVEVEIDIAAADLSIIFEGEGELLWNLERGLVHSFGLTGDTSFAFDLEVEVDAGGEGGAIEASIEMSGSMAMDLETG